MRLQRIFLIAASIALVAIGGAQAKASDPLHAWISAHTPAEFDTWMAERLATEQADLDKLLAVKGERTVENTLRPFDDAQNELAIAGNNAAMFYALGATAELRDKGQALTAKIASAQTDLGLNQAVYKALAAIPTPTNDAAAKHYLEHTLLEYRLTGVDKDEATRKRVHELQDHMTEQALVFGRNVQEGTLTLSATSAEVEGLPADFIARLKKNPDGTYILTTDQPDVGPVLSFAKSAALRKRMWITYNQRAYPKNQPVLLDVLKTRQELATTLGYKRYADLATADQMIGNAASVQKLIDDVNQVSRPNAEKEYAEVLAFAQKQDPSLKRISQADGGYWGELFRREKFDFDAQSVRPYFPYDQVQAGILSIAGRFFHVSFKPAADAAVWNPAVSTYDVFDAAPGNEGKPLGRIYLDMHPREGKDKWFSSSPVVPGIRGKQLPEGMLVCNFSGGKQGDPGLMEYSEVVTFFHEFGHLMHHILGSQGEWSAAGGFNVEGDFIESPSQMLEEIFHDPAILQSFGKHYQSGEVLPTKLIEKMNAASAFGRGRWLQAQLLYTSYSLDVHNMDPDKIDFDGLWADLTTKFIPYKQVDGTHFFSSFTHLTGYASNYYTYVLDKVIAIDFFSQFDKKSLIDGPAAMRYRRSVLEPGANKPASELVKDFLGRPENMDALKSWMNEEFSNPAAK